MNKNQNNILGFNKEKNNEQQSVFEQAAKLYKTGKIKTEEIKTKKQLTQEEKNETQQKIAAKKNEINEKHQERKKETEDRYQRQKNEIQKKEATDKARDDFYERVANEREEASSKKENEREGEINKRKNDAHANELSAIRKQSGAVNFFDSQSEAEERLKTGKSPLSFLQDEEYLRLARKTIENYGSKGGNLKIDKTNIDTGTGLQIKRINQNEQHALEQIEIKKMLKTQKIEEIETQNPQTQNTTIANEKAKAKSAVIKKNAQIEFLSDLKNNLKTEKDFTKALKITNEYFTKKYKEKYRNGEIRLLTLDKITGIQSILNTKIIKSQKEKQEQKTSEGLIKSAINNIKKERNSSLGFYSKLKHYESKYGKGAALNAAYKNGKVIEFEHTKREKIMNKNNAKIETEKPKLLGF